MKSDRVASFHYGLQPFFFLGLLLIKWVIPVDFPSADVFYARSRILARAQGAHPAHGRTQ
jgi:hypothetical protein